MKHISKEGTNGEALGGEAHTLNPQTLKLGETPGPKSQTPNPSSASQTPIPNPVPEILKPGMRVKAWQISSRLGLLTRALRFIVLVLGAQN